MLLLALADAQSPEIAKIALIVGFVVLSLSIHEWAHAYTAHLLGDDTAKSLGRMTPNPIAHIDPVMTILVPAVLYVTTGFVFGGAKPVPVDPRNFKNPHAANALVAAAGPLSNLVLAFVFVAAYRLSIELGGYQASQLLPNVLIVCGLLNVVLAVFNMIPIPPLDGSRIVMWILPPNLRPGYAALEGLGIFIVLAALFLTPLRFWVFATVNDLLEAIDSLVRHLVQLAGV